MHRQLYKGYRADSDKQLHADMVGETHKVARAAQAAADADTPLKAAVSRGDDAAVARLFAAAPPAERRAAFVVACARGRGAALATMAAASSGVRGGHRRGVGRGVAARCRRGRAGGDDHPFAAGSTC